MHLPEFPWHDLAEHVLRAEADTLLQAASHLDDGLDRAVELLLGLPKSKIMVTGVGKSGHIAGKMVATLCSTGSQAVFLHPVDALHGDLGVYTPGDPTIILSKSGATSELLRLVPLLRSFNSPLIGILGNRKSPLAEKVDILIDATVADEADPHHLVPTSSTTLALALGDALAIMLMQARQFTPDDYARFHPAGQLGRNLLLTVKDVMHTGDRVAWAQGGTSLREVVISMTQRPLGAACVVDDQQALLGIITDGDLRRALITHDDIRCLCAQDVMTRSPIAISANALLKDALERMENRPRQISVLPVLTDDSLTCLGLVRIHDIYADI